MNDYDLDLSLQDANGIMQGPVAVWTSPTGVNTLAQLDDSSPGLGSQSGAGTVLYVANTDQGLTQDDALEDALEEALDEEFNEALIEQSAQPAGSRPTLAPSVEPEQPEEIQDFESSELNPLPSHKFRSNITDTCLALFVGTGEDQSVFTINKQLLCHYSPFMDFELSQNPTFEGEIQVYRLNRLAPDGAYSFMIEWLNTQKIDPLVSEAGRAFHLCFPNNKRIAKRVTEDDMMLLRTYVLAGYFSIPELQEYIGERMRFRFHHFMAGSVECLAFIGLHSEEHLQRELRSIYQPLIDAIAGEGATAKELYESGVLVFPVA